MSNLRIGHAICRFVFPILMSNQNSVMSHVKFKKWSMSLIFSPIWLGFVSHVYFLENVCIPLLHLRVKSLGPLEETARALSHDPGKPSNPLSGWPFVSYECQY